MNLRHILGITLATAAFAIPALGEEPSLHGIAVNGSAGPIIDLNADFWKGAPAVTVSTQPQTIANPQNPSPAIGELAFEPRTTGSGSPISSSGRTRPRATASSSINSAIRSRSRCR